MSAATTSLSPQEFDNLVNRLSSPNHHDVAAAQEELSAFKKNPDSFFACGVIIDGVTTQAAKFIALQMLEEGIAKRWNVLTEEQQGSLRAYLLNQIITACRGGWESMRAQKLTLTKMNTSLIAIAKREWPHRWPTFIRDVCSLATGVDDPMVENNIRLLTLLGEDIFEFGDKGMTSRAAARKKVALQADFQLVYQVLVAVLTQSTDTMLTNAALLCFTKYVPWMPFDNVFDHQFLDYLSTVCITNEVFRFDALKCLTEIASLPILAGPQGDKQKQLMVVAFRNATQHIMNFLPQGHSNLSARIRHAAELDPDGADAICLWLTTYLARYVRYTLHDDLLLKGAHEMVVGLTSLADRKEMFKTCIEYWWWLGETLLRGFGNVVPQHADVGTSSSLSSTNVSTLPTAQPPRTPAGQLHAKLNHVLADVRFVLIKNMARPEEVILVEDEGELRKETMKDVETLQLYQLMREALIFFTHLDSTNTFTIMTMLMARQLDRSEWSWGNCNTLCWAVGSISGSMSMESEKDLFVAIMSDLLKLCKEMVGKENRAVIASNIMYVVGQYPRFLRTHKSFLRTVSRKLFEFMRESFPGVQDMAVDTFLKLARHVPEVFLDAGTEPKPFVITIIQDAWGSMTELLQPSHIESIMCAMGYMVRACSESIPSVPCDLSEDAQMVLAQLLNGVQGEFLSAMDVVVNDFGRLFNNNELLRRLLHLLRQYRNVASSCGPIFIQVMQGLLPYLQVLYRTCSATLSNLVSTHGPAAVTGNSTARALRLLKRETLQVIEVFVENTLQDDFVAKSCMPQVFESVLSDYLGSYPLAREAGTLALVTACVKRLKGLLADDCSAILDHTFTPTTELIVSSMADFPEHRVNLFHLLHALNEHCFDAFLAYISSHEDVVASILWAIKHTERNVMTTGLELLLSLLVRVVGASVGESFYVAYMHRILTEVLVCAVDTLHTGGFQLQCSILQHLFQVSNSVPPAQPVIGRNDVSIFFEKALQEIPTLVPQQIQAFVERSYATSDSSMGFRQHVADFLIEVQIWGAEQENALHREEERRDLQAHVPGIDNSSLAVHHSSRDASDQTEW